MSGRPTAIVLGAGGQLGHALLEIADAARISAVGLPRAELDVTDGVAVTRLLNRVQPDIVINAAAYTAVDGAESEAKRAFAVNRDGPAAIAEACAAAGIPLIHVSTDYVFDGMKQGAYEEDDKTAPLSVYGHSKLAGEIAIRQRRGRHAIVRTSWVFGVQGSNFVKSILRAAAARRDLRVVADQYGCPTPAADLAEALLALSHRMLADPGLGGTFHFAGADPLSRHAFAEAILDAAQPWLGRPQRVVPIATSEHPVPARRPPNSVLACRRLAALGIPPKPWHRGLETVVSRVCNDMAAQEERTRKASA